MRENERERMRERKEGAISSMQQFSILHYVNEDYYDDRSFKKVIKLF